jgi:hypothetical protein
MIRFRAGVPRWRLLVLPLPLGRKAGQQIVRRRCRPVGAGCHADRLLCQGLRRGAGGTAGNRPDLAGDAAVAAPQLRPSGDGAVPDGPVGQARDIGWGKGLYIGDISQPRGGPMTSGHASHQIGLDADIWMLPPRSG